MKLNNYNDFNSHVYSCKEMQNFILQYQDVLIYPPFYTVYLAYLDLGLQWKNETISTEVDLLTNDLDFALKISNCMNSLTQFPYSQRYGLSTEMGSNGNYHLTITFP